MRRRSWAVPRDAFFQHNYSQAALEALERHLALRPANTGVRICRAGAACAVRTVRRGGNRVPGPPGLFASKEPRKLQIRIASAIKADDRVEGAEIARGPAGGAWGTPRRHTPRSATAASAGSARGGGPLASAVGQGTAPKAGAVGPGFRMSRPRRSPANSTSSIRCMRQGRKLSVRKTRYGSTRPRQALLASGKAWPRKARTGLWHGRGATVPGTRRRPCRGF